MAMKRTPRAAIRRSQEANRPTLRSIKGSFAPMYCAPVRVVWKSHPPGPTVTAGELDSPKPINKAAECNGPRVARTRDRIRPCTSRRRALVPSSQRARESSPSSRAFSAPTSLGSANGAMRSTTAVPTKRPNMLRATPQSVTRATREAARASGAQDTSPPSAALELTVLELEVEEGHIGGVMQSDQRGEEQQLESHAPDQ